MLLSTGFIDGRLSWPFSCNRELKRATSLSHGRKPDVNISPARTVGSSRFSNLSSILNNINVLVRGQVEWLNSSLLVAGRSSETARA